MDRRPDGSSCRLLLAAAAVLLHVVPCVGFEEPKSTGLLSDKTLVAWVRLEKLDQTGGSVLTIQTPSEEFDGLVFGEVAPGKWMAGSDNHDRTQRDQSANPPESADARTRVQLAVVYEGRSVRLCRDGRPYARYDHEGPTLAFDESAVVVMGLRHLAASAPNAFLGAIEEARIYDRALDEATIAALRPDDEGPIPPLARWTFEGGKAEDVMGRFRFTELRGGARVVDGELRLDKPGDCLVARREKPWQEEATARLRYRPASGRVGDTIPFFWKGEYHVFFLSDGRWDHIVSTDLVRWRDLPPALKQGDDPLGPDGEACWTGSVVEHAGTFHLFYTGKNMRDPAGDQKVMVATSPDLIRWEKRPDRTFYADGEHYWSKPRNGPAEPVNYHHQAFRDPDVFFHEGERRWLMILHALTAVEKKPCIALYTSPDLESWAPQAPLAIFDPSVSLDCPHPAPIQGRWFIIAADTSYTTAPAPRGPYPSAMDPYDVGDLFVPKSLFDGRRRIIWGWVRDLEGGKDRGKPLWGGTMSKPREIFPDERGRLCSRPPAESVAAYSETAFDLASRPPLLEAAGGWRYDGDALVSGAAGGACRIDAPGDYLVECTVELDRDAEFTLDFRQPEAAGPGYPLIVAPARAQAEIRRGDSRFARLIDVDCSRPITIRAFVQGTIIECFITDRHALTSRAYDRREGRLGLGVSGGKARVSALRVATLPRS